MFSPRGRIVFTNRAIGTFQIGGLKPRAIAYVKTGCRKYLHDFWHHVQRLGIDAVHVQEVGDNFLSVYDCAGTVDALRKLLSRQCVKDWHFAMDSKVR
jgi:hypothetical protein